MKKRLLALMIILIVLLPIGIVFAETFGDATPSGSVANFENQIRGVNATCPEAGTADSIDIPLNNIPGSACFVKCALYKASDKSFVGETEERDLNGVSDGLISFEFSDPKPSLIAQDYIICWWTNNSDIRFWYQSNASFTRHLQTLTYNGWPNPLVSTTSSYRYSAQCTYTPTAGEEEYFFGTINPQFTIDSHKTISFNRYPAISQVFTVTKQTAWTFSLASAINQVFTIESLADFSANVHNFLGVIAQTFSVNSYKTWIFNVYPTISQTLTIESTFSAGVLRNVFGVIGQLFSLASHRTTSFLIDSILNQVFTIQSSVIFPGLVNIESVINLISSLISHASFSAPVEYATKGFVLVTIILIVLCFAVAVPIILRRRR